MPEVNAVASLERPAPLTSVHPVPEGAYWYPGDAGRAGVSNVPLGTVKTVDDAELRLAATAPSANDRTTRESRSINLCGEIIMCGL